MYTRRSFLIKSSLAGIGGIIGTRAIVSGSAAKSRKEKVTLEEAWKIHKKCLIIDGHNDTPVERMTARNEIPMKWMEKDLSYQTDLQRMREGGQQYCALMIISAGRGTSPDTFRNFAEMSKQFEKNPDDIKQITTSADVKAAVSKGKVGIVSGIEGGWGPLDGRIENLRKFYDMGLRLSGISHGEGGSDPKYLQGSASIYKIVSPQDRKAEHSKSIGLTPFGLEVLKTSNELHILTDLSHINDKAYFEVIEKSSLIPVISHTAVYSLCQHGRCLTDDQIKALAARGGVIGITLVPEFIDNDPAKSTLDRFIDHIRYVVDKVGIDYVGIGTDYDGGVPQPIIPEVSRLVEITRGLMNRGFSEEEIKKIWGGNFLRVIQKVMPGV